MKKLLFLIVASILVLSCSEEDLSFARKNAEESISENYHNSDQQNTVLSSINVNSCDSVGQLDNDSTSVPSQKLFLCKPSILLAFTVK